MNGPAYAAKTPKYNNGRASIAVDLILKQWNQLFFNFSSILRSSFNFIPDSFRRLAWSNK